MYAIFTYILLIFMAKVGKYAVPVPWILWVKDCHVRVLFHAAHLFPLAFCTLGLWTFCQGLCALLRIEAVFLRVKLQVPDSNAKPPGVNRPKPPINHYPKDPGTLQWRGWNLYSRGPGSQNRHFWGVRILRVAEFQSPEQNIPGSQADH